MIYLLVMVRISPDSIRVRGERLVIVGVIHQAMGTMVLLRKRLLVNVSLTVGVILEEIMAGVTMTMYIDIEVTFIGIRLESKLHFQLVIWRLEWAGKGVLGGSVNPKRLIMQARALLNVMPESFLDYWTTHVVTRRSWFMRSERRLRMLLAKDMLVSREERNFMLLFDMMLCMDVNVSVLTMTMVSRKTKVTVA